jgi:hypothetical protein
MTIKRCSNRPTSQFHALEVSDKCFDELKEAIKGKALDITLREDNDQPVLILSEYVLVRKNA